MSCKSHFNKERIMKQQKFLSYTVIIIFVAVFSIWGIIACSGDGITGGGGSYSYSGGTGSGGSGTGGGSGSGGDIGEWGGTNGQQTNDNKPNTPDNTPTTPDNSWDNDPNNNIFASFSYMNLYTPHTGGPNHRRVSYMNVNKLTALWRKTIEHGRYGNGRRWLIRNGDNYHADPRIGNYYFFDKDLNIVYRNNDKNQTEAVLEFLEGIVVDYSSNSFEGGKITNWNGNTPTVYDAPGQMAGTWTIGGLYRKTMNRGQYTGYGNDGLNIFMHSHHDAGGNQGLMVIVMNIGYADGSQDEFGLDSYYCTEGAPTTDKDYYIGQNPHTYKKYLNWRVNMTPNWGRGFARDTIRKDDKYTGSAYYWFYKEALGHWEYKDNYKFVHAFPYDWHTNQSYVKKQR